MKRFVIGALIGLSLVMPLPTSLELPKQFSALTVSTVRATTDDGTCRRLAKEQGITYRGAWEMNVAGCVYSSTKKYYVPRSGSCNQRARTVTQQYPYPRGWEIARRISKYCTADGNGIYSVR